MNATDTPPADQPDEQKADRPAPPLEFNEDATAFTQGSKKAHDVEHGEEQTDASSSS